MSINFSYANIPTQQSSKNAAVTLLSLTGISPAAERVEKNGLVKIADYVLKGTDASKPTTMTIRQEMTKDGGRRNSLRISTTVTRTDTVTNATMDSVNEVVIAWNHPGPYLEGTSNQGMSRLIQVAFGMLMTAFDGTTGAPTFVTLDDINYGIVNNLK